MKFLRCLLGLTALVAAAWPYAIQSRSDADFFETRIRPVLALECYSCHTDSQLGGLRLDSREAMLKGGKSGPAIVPGEPEKSLLYIAISQSGPLKMPKGGKLAQAQIDAVYQWIKSGANWPVTTTAANSKDSKTSIDPARKAFWSFQPLHPSTPPDVKESRWNGNPIDRFVYSRLLKEGISPVAPADRRTLIRRATLDLTGLPPTADEIAAFEADKSNDAFAKVVDRLLASPQYGERWGRFWLDVARYGEDDYRSLDPMGRGFAPYPNAYLYRDWVVKAFNDDLSYDLFVKAQLAADQLDEKLQVKMLPALGFLGQGPWFYDNGAIEVTKADERHDRIDVVSRGFLGLTVGCARCHDHKYDPIPTADYYAMGGVFASTVYKEYPQVPQGVVDEFKAAEKKLKSREKAQGEFYQTESKQLAETLVLQASKYMRAVWRVYGEPKEDLNDVIEKEKLDYELMQRWIRFLSKPPTYYPFLKDWQAMMAKGGPAADAKRLADNFQSLIIDVLSERKELNAENEIIIAKSLAGTKKKEPLFKPSEFVTNDDFCPSCEVETKSMPTERTSLFIDVFARDLDDPGLPGVAGKPKPGLLSFNGWGLERQLSSERRAYLNALKEDIEKFRKEMPTNYPYVHGVGEQPKPVDLPISLRGNPKNNGPVVQRGFLTVLSGEGRQTFSKGSGRMELAEAILAQPISMRVIVNRIWKGHFGTGIVDTPSNFGFNGERPVHGELLEYLADSFKQNGLSIKKLHREIMLSATYQLSNDMDQAAYKKDSGNRLYWRSNKRRMDAEQIRDSLLSVSGALEKKIGGPSEVLTPKSTRRTLYAKISRYKLDEYLQLFDFPSPSISAEQRYSTNVPLQRLFFMNSDFVQQQAELIAASIASEPTATARIQKAYKIILGRPASTEEVNAGLEFIKAEPQKIYEDLKKAEAEKEKKKAEKKDMPEKPLPSEMGRAGDPEGGEPGGDGGMMMGVTSGTSKDGDKKKTMLPVTPWGRYIKVLLSSPEFEFIN